MDRNENIFLLLHFLRSELKAFKVDEVPAVNLVELPSDIAKAIQGVTCPGSDLQASELLEITVGGIKRAQQLTQQNLFDESALIARTSLTSLLISKDLFQ